PSSSTLSCVHSNRRTSGEHTPRSPCEPCRPRSLSRFGASFAKEHSARIRSPRPEHRFTGVDPRHERVRCGCMRSWTLGIALVLVGCAGRPAQDAGPPDSAVPAPPSAPAPEPYVALVDPFLGTGGLGFNDTGSTFPGPQRPFGMVRPGPDTSGESG